MQGGRIVIDASSLQTYNTFEELPFQGHSGTKVSFKNLIILYPVFENEILSYITKEFGWYLELNKDKSLKINGNPIDYQNLIIDNDYECFEYEGASFQVNYLQWSSALNKEQSKYYYLNGWGKEVYKDFTSMNRKGDRFYHSIYVQSDFFDDFIGHNKLEESSGLLFGNPENQKIFKKLNSDLILFLRKKRRPLLRAYGEELINSFEKLGVLPEYHTAWDRYRLVELKEVLVGLYEVQPKIFVDLNVEQKKTFVRFINLILDSNERDRIFEILNDITSLSTEEMNDLASILKSTKLDRIIATIKLIEDRFKAVEHLKSLVFNKELKADEIFHLQTFIENHYWIFGEQYNLLTSAEPNFNEALRRYSHYLHKEYKEDGLEHPDRLKAMDIFMCRQEYQVNKIHNVVVELKHPNIALGENQLAQIRKYMNVVSSADEFNANNASWDFILVGNKFNGLREIELAMQNAKNHGERSLVFAADNYRIYVKTWAEIFNEFQLKHQFIDVKLRLEKSSINNSLSNANDVLYAGLNNSAIGDGELKY